MDIAEFAKKVDVIGFVALVTDDGGRIVAMDYHESADEAMAAAEEYPCNVCYVLRGARFEYK